MYEQLFDTYELELGTFPPSQPVAGMFPIGMEDRLSPRWKYPSPVGGDYRWGYDPNAKIDFAYIEVVNSANNPINVSLNRLLEIDKDLDDGDINTGRIRLSGLNVTYFVR